MQTRTPQEFQDRYHEVFSSGDMDAVMALYESDAVFVSSPDGDADGTRARGHDEIREALKEFMKLTRVASTAAGETTKIVEAGDVAVVHTEWEITGVQNGESMKLGGRGAHVMRRGADGNWRLVIDDPWGVGP